MMCKVLAIMCLFGIFLGTIQSSRYKDDVASRIIGGINVPITHRPFIISIHRRYSGFVCGGVIVAENWILTALHCIPSPQLKAQYFLRAGSRFHDRGGTFHVMRYLKLFNSSSLSEFGSIIPIHDITLVNVFPKFQFSVRIQPARLPQQDTEPPRKLWVSGWGVTSLGRLSDHLQTVNVHRVRNDLCQNMSKMYASLMSNDKHICYGGINKDSCNGDSGGPLGIARNVYGLVSFGVDCGKLPGVYVKISYYAEWIKSIIKKDL